MVVPGVMVVGGGNGVRVQVRGTGTGTRNQEPRKKRVFPGFTPIKKPLGHVLFCTMLDPAAKMVLYY